MKNNVPDNRRFDEVYIQVSDIIEKSKSYVARSVNTMMVHANGSSGKG